MEDKFEPKSLEPKWEVKPNVPTKNPKIEGGLNIMLINIKLVSLNMSLPTFHHLENLKTPPSPCVRSIVPCCVDTQYTPMAT
jgi:hypothetical protein